MLMTLRKICLGGLVLATSAVGLTVTSAPAHAAASTQRICASKYTAAPIGVTDPYGNYYSLAPSKCVPAAPKGSVITIGTGAYKVAYNYGKYSDCRGPEDNFVPWQKADVIYFRSYYDYLCRT